MSKSMQSNADTPYQFSEIKRIDDLCKELDKLLAPIRREAKQTNYRESGLEIFGKDFTIKIQIK